MKICSKCGAEQKDSRLYCVDCGARLGKRLTAEETAQKKAELDSRMDELFDEGAGLKAGPVEKISAAAALVGAVVSVGLFVLRVAGVLNLSHSILDSLGWLLFELFFFGGGALMSLRPKKLWEGEKEWLAWYYDGGDAVAPSVIGVYRRRIGAVVSLVIGFLLIGICLYQGTLLAGLPNVPDVDIISNPPDEIDRFRIIESRLRG